MDKEAHSIEYDYKARMYKGSYTVDGKVVTVECDYGSQSAETHEGNAESLAEILLGVLLVKADEAGRLASGRF